MAIKPGTVPGEAWVAVLFEELIMKPDIHPKYGEITATCTCGNVIKTASTLRKDIHTDVCAACHPFYTGKQKTVDTGGRIDRFNKRFAGRSTTPTSTPQ